MVQVSIPSDVAKVLGVKPVKSKITASENKLKELEDIKDQIDNLKAEALKIANKLDKI